MKNSKKFLAILAAVAVLVTMTAALSVTAGVPDDIEPLVTPVQDFDALAVGAVAGDGAPNTGSVLGPQWWSTPYSGAEIVERATGDNWLKVVGNAANPYASPIRLAKNVYSSAAGQSNPYANANVCDADMDTFVFYIKGDASKKLAFLPVFYEHNPNSIGYVGGRFAATDASPYTLISKDGVITEVEDTDNLVDIAAGFEGWVLYPLVNADYRYDDGVSTDDGNTKEVLDPGRILAVEIQANCDSSGATWYLDDFCMTKNAAAIKTALEAKTDDAPTGIDMWMGQGFGIAEVGNTAADLESLGIIRGEKDITNITHTVTDNTLGNGNALTWTFNGTAGEFLGTGNTDIGLYFSDEDRAAMATADSLVLRVKTPATTKYENSFDLRVMLMEARVIDGSRDYGAVGGVFFSRDDFGVNPCDVTLVDAATKQYTVKTINAPYFLPADFDGWVVLPLSYFKLHPGYAGDDNNGEMDIGEMVRIKMSVENAPLGEKFVFDTIGFAEAKDFLASIEAAPLPVDIEIEKAPDSIEKVTAAQVGYAKDNAVSIKYNVTDGYKLYGWVIAGSDITTVQEFDPALVTEFDEIADIKDQFVDLEGYFFKNSALPGKAELSIYLGDDYTTPYLYSYADGKATKVTQLAVDDDGYVAFEMNAAGTWFITEEEVVNEIPKTGVVVPAAILALAVMGGAATVIGRKKEND